MSPPLFNEDQTDQREPIPWYIRVWAAVIRRSVVDWILYKEHKSTKLRKIGQDADLWMFKTPPNEKDITTFHSVCDILNVGPEIIRGRVQNLSEEDARRLRGMEFGDEW